MCLIMEEKMLRGFTAPNKATAIEEVNRLRISREDLVSIDINHHDNEVTVFYYGKTA